MNMKFKWESIININECSKKNQKQIFSMKLVFSERNTIFEYLNYSGEIIKDPRRSSLWFGQTRGFEKKYQCKGFSFQILEYTSSYNDSYYCSSIRMNNDSLKILKRISEINGKKVSWFGITDFFSSIWNI